MSRLFSRAVVCMILTTMAGPAASATTYGPPTPTAFPIHPFQASLFVTANTSAVTGTLSELGITSITLANQSSGNVQVDIFQAATSGARCTSNITTLGSSPNTYVMVPAYQTLHLAYPTPLVIPRLGNASCIGFDAVSGLPSGNSIGIVVNGFQN